MIDWVRRLGKRGGWTVRCVDMVDGSPNHALKFIDTQDLPEAMKDGTLEGRYRAQMAKDMVQFPLLLRHGGVWMDAGILLFRHLDDFCWNVISDKGSPFEFLTFQWPPSGDIGNYFTAARKDNPLVKHAHYTFLEMWKGRKNAERINEHPIVADVPKIPALKKMPGSSLTEADLNDYLSQVLAVRHVRNLKDDEWNGPEYERQHFYMGDQL